jgi:hypothetical protein
VNLGCVVEFKDDVVMLFEWIVDNNICCVVDDVVVVVDVLNI